MRHRKHRFKLNRTSSHRSALKANLVKALLMAGSVKTTIAKAKALRGFAERMVTLAKKNDLQSIRRINAELKIYRDYASKDSTVRVSSNNVAIKKLIDVAEANKDRNGGYTRIIRTNRRVGDGAEMCVFGFIMNEEKKVKAIAAA
ncbi:MAG: 50S ribosomal protein L17 [Chlamydiia bacterium]|nr:50S ribosomal protein L17 [Chlamydiia bacterium]